MANVKIKLNGNEVIAQEGQTILEVARENGIEIPTLCHDEHL
ncbi:MAG: (2Fe-2S)-binding protein, partial [Candidatus Cloacimonetes bacterium]|nr:(2Fe-2S)-binding protein [Candidatus Cloacimonadota bacterium]